MITVTRKSFSVLRIERGGSKIFLPDYRVEGIAPTTPEAWLELNNPLFRLCLWGELAAKNNLSEHRTILCSFLIAFTVVRAGCCRVRVIRRVSPLFWGNSSGVEKMATLDKMIYHSLIFAMRWTFNGEARLNITKEEGLKLNRIERERRARFLKSGPTKGGFNF